MDDDLTTDYAGQCSICGRHFRGDGTPLAIAIEDHFAFAHNLAYPEAVEAAKRELWHVEQRASIRRRRGTLESWSVIRRRIYERDRGVCQICGRQTRIDGDYECGHIIDRYVGGSDRDDNLLWSCAALATVSSRSTTREGSSTHGEIPAGRSERSSSVCAPMSAWTIHAPTFRAQTSGPTTNRAQRTARDDGQDDPR